MIDVMLQRLREPLLAVVGPLMMVILVVGLVATAIWVYFIFKRHQLKSPDEDESISDMTRQTDRLLAQMHQVTTVNVETIEERINTLRELGVYADQRIKKLESMVKEADDVIRHAARVKADLPDTTYVFPKKASISEITSIDSIQPKNADPLVPADGERRDTAIMLKGKGLTVKEISERMGLGVASVRFLINLSEGTKSGHA